MPLEPPKAQGPDVNVDTVLSGDDRARANGASQGPASSLGRPFQILFVPQGDDDRADRIAADLGMDVDVFMEGSARESLSRDDGAAALSAAVSRKQKEEDSDAIENDLKDLLAVLTRDVRDEVKKDEADIIATIRAMGGCAQSYRRERRRAVKAMVSEVYSPPRVTAACKLFPELKIIPGFAFTTAVAGARAWDFDEKEMRDRALERVRREQPMLLVGSPMCTAFSTWQRISNNIEDPVAVAAELRRAVMHLEFCVSL